jgi:iron-sulfur cluster repair protein YtfE (RIC family)
MEEASAREDWRAFAPEYPRLKKLEAASADEKMKALKNSPEFTEMDKELKEYLRKKEDLFYPELHSSQAQATLPRKCPYAHQPHGSWHSPLSPYLIPASHFQFLWNF